MGQTALLPFRRKACWGFFRPEKIRRLRPGLNTRTLVPKASTLPLEHRSRYLVVNSIRTISLLSVQQAINLFSYILHKQFLLFWVHRLLEKKAERNVFLHVLNIFKLFSVFMHLRLRKIFLMPVRPSSRTEQQISAGQILEELCPGVSKIRRKNVQLFKRLKTNRRLLYVKTQFVPRSKNFSSRL